MTIVLYGGEDSDDVLQRLDQVIAKRIKKGSTSLYIPADSFEFEEHFSFYQERFKELKRPHVIATPLEYETQASIRYKISKADHIYFSGGNTFNLLYQINRLKLRSTLKSFYKQKNGLLSGLSAGAIIMSPNIMSASYPKFDCDDNYLNLKKFDALQLFNFEFFPHYYESIKYSSELMKQSKKTNFSIIASSDKAGVIISPSSLCFIGKNVVYTNGQKFVVKPIQALSRRNKPLK